MGLLAPYVPRLATHLDFYSSTRSSPAVVHIHLVQSMPVAARPAASLVPKPSAASYPGLGRGAADEPGEA